MTSGVIGMLLLSGWERCLIIFRWFGKCCVYFGYIYSGFPAHFTMVLDYIITVWDTAEPKTYNSKVSWDIVNKHWVNGHFITFFI